MRIALKISGRKTYEQQVVLSYINPHNPVASSTLARWIKNILLLAGIDTETSLHIQ